MMPPFDAGDIVIRYEDPPMRRVRWELGTERKGLGLFHGWLPLDGGAWAVVEKEDGSCVLVPVWDVQFIKEGEGVNERE